MSGDAIKVLLIEDNPGDARLIRELLADHGRRRFALTVSGTLTVIPPRLSISRRKPRKRTIMTWLTSKPRNSSVRRTRSAKTKVRQLPMCAKS